MPSSFLIMVGSRLLILGSAVIIVGGAAALGSRLMRLLVPEADGPERIIFGAGLGLGIISTLVLLLAHISTDLLVVVFAFTIVALQKAIDDHKYSGNRCT